MTTREWAKSAIISWLITGWLFSYVLVWFAAARVLDMSGPNLGSVVSIIGGAAVLFAVIYTIGALWKAARD